MANLTIVIDDDVLRRARVRAAEQGTSVNAVLRDELARYADVSASERAADRFLSVARVRSGHSEGGTRSWTRDDLYDDRTR